MLILGGEDVPFYRIALDTSSSYYNSSNNNWTIPLRDISVPYINGHTYELDLSWNYDNIDGEVYTWTTNFSAQVIADLQANGQQAINNMDGFLTNTYYNKDYIVSQFPSAPTFSYDGETYVNQLFDIISDTFTSTESEDFVFTFPNTTDTLTIPANYIENKLPSSIIFLIQLFYWYFISRFILKDVMRSIDKIRNGSYWITDESDIKTEVL